MIAIVVFAKLLAEWNRWKFENKIPKSMYNEVKQKQNLCVFRIFCVDFHIFVSATLKQSDYTNG